MDLELLEELQTRLAGQVVVPSDGEGYFPAEGDLLCTLDVQYAGEDAYVALDLMRWPSTLVGVHVYKLTVEVAYVPGFFAFREGPVLKAALEQLRIETGLVPQVLLVDGHGTAHPRRFGVACWLGLETGLPSVGCAKEPLVRYEGDLGAAVGSKLDVVVDGVVAGYVLRTVEGVKPVFVSPGHLVSLEGCVRMVLALGGGVRVVEPVRRADQAARRAAKG